MCLKQYFQLTKFKKLVNTLNPYIKVMPSLHRSGIHRFSNKQ